MDKDRNLLIENTMKRRTFAIISHPDAGKTTLTEKLLLLGGAIRTAGAVKGRKAKRHATSDWMEIEQQRGISVTSSAMQFEYRGSCINILDTPGHQDFSEDTYRTLTAADSAVMLIDVAKGVEAQTIKLFEVCRLRKIPILTFINKLDRHGKDPLDLLEEIEKVLSIRSCPMNWPIGMGSDFCGIYDRQNKRVEFYKGKGTTKFIKLGERGLDDLRLSNLLDKNLYEKLCEEIALLDIAGDPFDEDKIRQGILTPVFFGSAITDFGVQTFLENFLELAPLPGPRNSNIGFIDPFETSFSGFVFKIQANMNPAHRDRIAFLRVCSGKFERGMVVNHVRTGKKIKLTQPQQLMAASRDIIEEAYPGDIIGLFDPGIFQIGDTLCLEGSFQYEKLPQFTPEHFAKILVRDTSKYKQFHKGINQLAEEGAIQIYRTVIGGAEDLVIGVVGMLQFEVLEYRLKAEYGVEIILQFLPYELARWIVGDKIDATKLQSNETLCLKDQSGELLLLFKNKFYLKWIKDKNPQLNFVESL